MALMAFLQSASADADVGLAGTIKDDRERRREPLQRALGWLKRAHKCEYFGFYYIGAGMLLLTLRSL